MGYLFQCGAGEDDLAYAAKLLTITLHREALSEEAVDRLAALSPGRIMGLLDAMRRADLRLEMVPRFVSEHLASPAIHRSLSARRVLEWGQSAA
jgi:hypothetical protein